VRISTSIVTATVVALLAGCAALPGGDAADPSAVASMLAGPSGAPDGTGDGTGDSTGDGTGGTNSPTGDATNPAPDAATEGSASTEPAAAPGTQPAATQPPAQALTAISDRGGVGTNGPAYLRGDRGQLVLEVDIQPGTSLSNGVLQHVSSILDRESAASVAVDSGPVRAGQQAVWSVAQLRALAASERDIASTDATAVMHLLVLDGRFEQESVLGLAFDASTAVVFPDQWASLTGALLSGDTVARAVAIHEVGHLLGLVGLVEPPTSDHEDPAYPGHTTDEDDVMYHAVETNLIVGLSSIPTDFGPLTRADLAALRAG
jgi:hypothetical protein